MGYKLSVGETVDLDFKPNKEDIENIYNGLKPFIKKDKEILIQYLTYDGFPEIEVGIVYQSNKLNDMIGIELKPFMFEHGGCLWLGNPNTYEQGVYVAQIIGFKNKKNKVKLFENKDACKYWEEVYLTSKNSSNGCLIEYDKLDRIVSSFNLVSSNNN